MPDNLLWALSTRIFVCVWGHLRLLGLRINDGVLLKVKKYKWFIWHKSPLGEARPAACIAVAGIKCLNSWGNVVRAVAAWFAPLCRIGKVQYLQQPIVINQVQNLAVHSQHAVNFYNRRTLWTNMCCTNMQLRA